MSKFLIEPHFRLQEWVAEEKGYFRAEGLDYEFKEFIRATDGAHHATAGKSGAFQSIEKGRESNVTCARHSNSDRDVQWHAHVTFDLRPFSCC